MSGRNHWQCFHKVSISYRLWGDICSLIVAACTVTCRCKPWVSRCVVLPAGLFMLVKGGGNFSLHVPHLCAQINMKYMTFHANRIVLMPGCFGVSALCALRIMNSYFLSCGWKTWVIGEVRRVRFEDVMARSTCQSVTHVNRYVISFSPHFSSLR